MNSIFVYTPTWRKLRQYGGSKVIKSSYIWVVVVPILAKLAPEVEKTLSTNGYSIDLSLPFSWHLFYFSAIFFAISSLIFTNKCPYLIKSYATPKEFNNDGKGIKELDDYYRETFRRHKKPALMLYSNEFLMSNETGANISQLQGDESIFYSNFWTIQKNIQYKREFWRLLCVMGYAFGFILLFIVLVQNFIYVFKEFISTLNF